MITTIDSAGRLVVPKALREAMGLTAGVKVDIVFTDGRLEIDYPPAAIRVDTSSGFPRAIPLAPMPPLDDETIRAVLESTRR